MHPMTQLMRYRLDIPQVARIIDKHIRVHIRHGRMRECTACLALYYRGVYPALIEEVPGRGLHLGREPAECPEDHILAGRPINSVQRQLLHRGIPVKVIKGIETQKRALNAIIAADQAVTAGHGVYEGVHRGGIHLVGEIHGTDPVKISPESVLYHLVRNGCIEYMSKDVVLAFQAVCKLNRRISPHCAIRGIEIREHLLLAAALLAETLEGKDLVKELDPGRTANRTDVHKEPLLVFRKKMWPVAPCRLKIVSVISEHGIAQQRFRRVIRHMGPFKIEKYHPARYKT